MHKNYNLFYNLIMASKILKKFIFYIVIILCATTSHSRVFAQDTSSDYAQIVTSGYLYHSPNKSLPSYNQICMLEASYFVKIILVHDNDFYFVSYNEVEGYVLKSVVKKIIGTPKNKFPNLTVSTNENKCLLRSSPMRTDSNILATIEANTTSIKYIGKIIGQEMWDFGGTTWYFVNYHGLKGYIYGGYLTTRPVVPPNTEQISFIESESYLTVNPLSNQQCLVIIFITLIPAVFILVVLFKKPKLPVKKPAKVIRQHDEIDYDSLL